VKLDRQEKVEKLTRELVESEKEGDQALLGVDAAAENNVVLLTIKQTRCDSCPKCIL